MRTRDQVPADRADARGARSSRAGRDRGEPGQSDRHRDPTRRAGGDRVVVRGVRCSADQRRGLSRPGVRGRSRHQLRMGDIAGSRCGEQLFEILRDDRMAAGLAAGTEGAAARGGPPDGKLHHLPARAVPDRRGCGVHAESRSPRRMRCSITTPPTGSYCSTGCERSASTGSRRPTARSTSMRTYRI